MGQKEKAVLLGMAGSLTSGLEKVGSGSREGIDPWEGKLIDRWVGEVTQCSEGR